MKERKRNHYTILGLGDSITEGVGKNKSYLFPLWKRLLQAGYETEFVGPRVHKCPFGSIMNAGFSGKNAEYLDVHIDSIYRKYPADVVLLHTGHNHFAEENPVAGIIAAQKSIISKIVAINPNVKIFVAKVIPSGKLPKYSYISELNRQISRMVKQMKINGLPVSLVDQAKDFNWEKYCNADKVHPNSLGAEAMANAWFYALEKELKPATNPYCPEIVTYKKTDSTQLNLHLFKPEGNSNPEEKLPAIIFFFGGGWAVGSPLQFYRECRHYASKGMVAISAEYRIKYLHHSTVFESAEDAKSAIRWLRENADEYHIDTSRIVAAGASAGGHIAAVAGMINRFDEKNENLKISSKPNLLLLYYPVLDNAPDGFGYELLRDRYAEISPMEHVAAGIPPTLIISGTEDPYFPPEKAGLFRQKMIAAGNDCMLKIYKNAGHPLFYYRKGMSENYFKTLTDSDAFLRKYKYIIESR